MIAPERIVSEEAQNQRVALGYALVDRSATMQAARVKKHRVSGLDVEGDHVPRRGVGLSLRFDVGQPRQVGGVAPERPGGIALFECGSVVECAVMGRQLLITRSAL